MLFRKKSIKVTSKNEVIGIKFNKSDISCIQKEKNAHLTHTVHSGGEVEITGNRKGLLMLAQAALAMAECKRTDGFHIHLDDLYEINKEDKSFIIQKKKSQG